MTNINYVIQLTRFIKDPEDYSSRCAVEYYNRPLLFTSKSEVYQWLAMNGYRKNPYRKGIYEKEGLGQNNEITWDNHPVSTDYTAVVLEVDPDRKKGNYQTLAICGHAE